MRKTLISLLAVLLCTGCQKRQADSTPRIQLAMAPVSPQKFQRFLPVTEERGGLAVDTETGILCRTWNWSPVSNKESTNKAISQASPPCFELYNLDAPAEKAIGFDGTGYTQGKLYWWTTPVRSAQSIPVDDIEKAK